MSPKYRRIDLVQGSPEWLAVRRQYFTASQAPVLFGICPYRNRLDLVEEKLYGREPEIDPFKADLYARGHASEAAARRWIAQHLGIHFEPAVLVSVDHPDLLASLDGHEPAAPLIMEAKYVGARHLADIKAGEIKAHHLCQVQAQLLVSGAEKCIYFATDPAGNSAWTEIFPDPKYQDEIARLAADFMRDLRAGKKPDPADADAYVVKDNALFADLYAAKAEMELAETRYERLKRAAARAFERHRRVRSGQVTMVRTEAKGVVVRIAKGEKS